MLLKPPYITFAFFCERVLHEIDGVLTAIRIVDRLVINTPTNISAQSKSPPPAIVHSVALVVGLKAGKYKGEGKLRIRGVAPSGKPVTPKPIEADVALAGGDSGANFIANFALQFKELGTYWFDIYFDGRLLTRTPLSVSEFPTQTPNDRTTSAKKKIRSSRKA